MNRFINLIKAIAISPVIVALWLVKEFLFWAALRVAGMMLLLNPRDIEWMPRERIIEQKKRVDESHHQMMEAIAASLK